MPRTLEKTVMWFVIVLKSFGSSFHCLIPVSKKELSSAQTSFTLMIESLSLSSRVVDHSPGLQL